MPLLLLLLLMFFSETQNGNAFTIKLYQYLKSIVLTKNCECICRRFKSETSIEFFASRKEAWSFEIWQLMDRFCYFSPEQVSDSDLRTEQKPSHTFRFAFDLLVHVFVYKSSLQMPFCLQWVLCVVLNFVYLLLLCTTFAVSDVLNFSDHFLFVSKNWAAKPILSCYLYLLDDAYIIVLHMFTLSCDLFWFQSYRMWCKREKFEMFGFLAADVAASCGLCIYFRKLYLLLHSNRLKLIPYSAYAAYILQFSFHSQSKLVHRAFCQRKYTDYQAWGHEYFFCLFSLFSSSCMLHYCYIHTMISSDFFSPFRFNHRAKWQLNLCLYTSKPPKVKQDVCCVEW